MAPLPGRVQPPGSRGRPRGLTVAIGLVAAALAAALLWPARRGPDRTLPLPGAGQQAIVFLGDSITSGHGLPLPETFPLRLGAALGVPVVNAGVSGDTTDGGLARLDRDVLGHRPRLVVVELGVNDVFRGVPRERTIENLRAIVRRIRAQGAGVVLVHFRIPLWTADGYRADLQALAQAEGAWLAEDFLDGVVPELATDGLHPGGEGHARLAARLDPFLRRILGP